MSQVPGVRHKLSGDVPQEPEKTGATQAGLSISINAMEKRLRNREYQKRWYYRHGGRVQDDHRRALVAAAVRRYSAKKKAEKAAKESGMT